MSSQITVVLHRMEGDLLAKLSQLETQLENKQQVFSHFKLQTIK